MKKLIQIFVAALMLSFCTTISFAQDAKTFYVCASTGFILTAATNSSSYDSFIWKDVSGGGSTTVGSNSEVLSLTSPAITDGIFVKKEYTLSVFKGAQGCYSDPVTYTVYVLPTPTVTLNTPDAQCAEVPTAVTLTATVGVSTLPSGVAANVFSWKKGTDPVTPANTTNVLSVTSSVTETYTVNVGYSFTGAATTNGGTKVTACLGTASATLTVNPKPTTPIVTFQ